MWRILQTKITCTGCFLTLLAVLFGGSMISGFFRAGGADHLGFIGGIILIAAALLAPFFLKNPGDPEAWRGDPMTQKQANYIRNLRGDPDRVSTKGEAHDYIDSLLK